MVAGLLFLFMLFLYAGAARAGSGAVDLPRFPSISPDGSRIVFSAGGDLWLADIQGGDANRLTRHLHDDLYSSWSPDGQAIVFASMRDGYMNLWRIQKDGTQVQQLTYSDRFMRNPDWSRDEEGREVITFSGFLEGDVYREHRPYRLSPLGGQHQRLHQAFGSEPRLSPDGSMAVFTRGGFYHDWNKRHYRGPDAMNIWMHHREEDRFEAITTRDGDDGMARWAGNDALIFMSDRELDTVNLFRVDLGEEELEPVRLTDFQERDVQYFDVSSDGSTVVLQGWDRLYSLDLKDGEAEPEPINLRAGDDGLDRHELRSIDREVTEAALSPDSQVMAQVAFGRVYVRHVDEHSPSRAVNPGSHARHRDPAWSPDGLRLYFTSDAGGSESIYKARVALTREEIRLGVHDITVDWQSKMSPQQAPAEGSELKPERKELHLQVQPEKDVVDIENEADDPFAPLHPVDPAIPRGLDPAPDPGAEPAHDPDPELQQEFEEDLALEPAEGMPLEMDPARWHDAVHFEVIPVVDSGHNDRRASPSPDGTRLSFLRGLGDLMVKDLSTGEKEKLVEGWDSSIHWRWSHDGQYIAYAQNDLDFSSNIFIVPADGSEAPVNITRHPRNDLNPRWSADGRILSFISNRSGNSYDLYRVYLDPDMENMTIRELHNYYREAGKEAEKLRPLPVRLPGSPPVPTSLGLEPARMDLENAWRRVEAVTRSPLNKTSNEMTPGGDRFLFNSGEDDLITLKWDGSERKRLGSALNVQGLNLTGKSAVYTLRGEAGIAPLAGGNHKRPGISDNIRIDKKEQSLQKFREAARVMQEHFYLSDMKGLDWPSLTRDYEELIKRTRTASEFSDISNRLMGELGASHTGVFNPGPEAGTREPSGRLGISYQQVRMEDGDYGFRVNEVVPGSPAHRSAVPLQPGDIITRIDMRRFEERETLLQRLRGTVGREVIVGFKRPAVDGLLSHHALVTPVSHEDLAGLRYDAFRDDSRKEVSRLSNGRLGYIHIQAMNQVSLDDFQAHLYSAAKGKEGLIIDVRNNAGGYTTDYILASIMASEHAYTVPAGADHRKTGHYPQDRLPVPRYTLPINMLANEKSYSNSEILAHAFKTLDRGVLVGEQTYGGVISTSGYRLIDGAQVRVPSRGWYLPDGTDMEQNGAVPDLRIKQTPEDEVAGRDRQLEKAVQNLLERLDHGKE
ncbi:S41 family peptidase [Desulfonatronospira sp.]|uniref:S41 family peptidase n=1 Tax=Desulfonatronospira sp. TaxID=1962951 RepID=UPI0025BE55A6|nr:S41 family peptidase [Desulfonatronospira sp.]